MPVKYARSGVPGGKDISPPLEWEGVPEGTKSFALICVDRHPIANSWIHWLVINIPASVRSFPEGTSSGQIPEPARELYNSYGYKWYGGTQPPSGSGVHDYEFTIYALSVEKIDLKQNPSFEEFNEAISGKVIGKATLIGKFSQ